MPVDPASAPATPPPYQVSWDATHEVIRFVHTPGSVCDERQAQEGTAAMHAMFDRPLPLLVDMRGLTKIERGAREHFKRDKGGVAAMALLVGSPVTRMIANFFMRTDVDATPSRMFSDETAALAWLGDYRP